MEISFVAVLKKETNGNFIWDSLFFFVLWQEYLVTERKEKPVSMNAFELISRSRSFNLENLFEKQTVCVVGL